MPIARGWPLTLRCRLLLLTAAGCATHRPLMAVNVPLADLRAQPRTVARPGIHDPLEETQLLYDERVRVLKMEDGWAQVEAVQQPEYTHGNAWGGYPGWVPADILVPAEPLPIPNIVVTEKWALSWEDPHTQRPSPWRFPMGAYLRAVDMGGQLWKVELLSGMRAWLPFSSARPLDEVRVLPPLEKRRLILHSAQHFIGDPYYWGGRSPVTPEYTSGVDCSGLVNLAYRTVGMDLPRDAHEQWLRAMPIATPRPADLIFLSEQNNPKRIVHVMLYEGDNQILEGPGTGSTVHRTSSQERLGRPMDDITPGTVVNGQSVFFGTYLP